MAEEREPVRVRISRGEGLSFVDAEHALNRLESLLRDHDVVIQRGSRIEDISLSVTEYLALHRGEMHLPPAADRRDQWLRMLGLVDLALKLIGATESPLFQRLLPHLKLFASADTDPSQNALTDRDDQDNHKLFELLIGAACIRFCDELLMEGPRSSMTNTPDLTVKHDGVRWGIACKVLHSDKTTTYRDRVTEAIHQIDRADVDRGIVCINVKSLIPFGDLLPFGTKNPDAPYEVFESDEAWTSRLLDFHRHLTTRIRPEHPVLVDAFRGSRAEPVVIHYVQSMVLRRRDGEPRMHPFATMSIADFYPEPIELRDYLSDFLSKLAIAIQWGQHSRFGASPSPSP